MPFVPWVILWVVIANFPRMDVICIWTVMTTTGITLIISCVQLEHQRLSIVGSVEKGRSKRIPTYPRHPQIIDKSCCGPSIVLTACL